MMTMALLVVAIGAFWRLMATGNGLFGAVAGAAWAALLWTEVVPDIRRVWKRRR